MNTQQDIRWLQRFANFRKALARLRLAAEVVERKMNLGDDVDELLEEGLVQRFEYTHELAWKVMKDYLEYQGYTDIRGSRDALRQALAVGLLDDGRWMESIADRNLTSHLYDDAEASRIFEKIITVYLPLLARFEQQMTTLVQ